MYELARIGVLEDALTAIREAITSSYPNGAPDELRGIYGIAATAVRTSDELATGKRKPPTGDTEQ